MSVPAAEFFEASEIHSAQQTRYRIRTARVTLEVEDVDTAAARVRGIASDVGGRVDAFEHRAPSRGVPRNVLTLRVPEARLDEAVQRIQEVGHVEHVTIAERDVTEQVVDLDVRLRNLRRLEERLLRLLDTRTAKLEEILAAERELARVRQEIERADAQRRSLEHEATWSRLEVVLHEPLPAIAGSSGGIVARLGASIVQAGDNLITTIAFLISALGVILPLGALAAAGYYVWSRQRRTRGPRDAKASA